MGTIHHLTDKIQGNAQNNVRQAIHLTIETDTLHIAAAIAIAKDAGMTEVCNRLEDVFDALSMAEVALRKVTA